MNPVPPECRAFVVPVDHAVWPSGARSVYFSCGHTVTAAVGEDGEFRQAPLTCPCMNIGRNRRAVRIGLHALKRDPDESA